MWSYAFNYFVCFFFQLRLGGYVTFSLHVVRSDKLTSLPSVCLSLSLFLSLSRAHMRSWGVLLNCPWYFWVIVSMFACLPVPSVLNTPTQEWDCNSVTFSDCDRTVDLLNTAQFSSFYARFLHSNLFPVTIVIENCSVGEVRVTMCMIMGV